MTTGDRILGVLPATFAEIVEQLEISRPIAHKWLTRLKVAKAIRIVTWRRTLGNIAAVFGPGRGQNARKPKPLTPAQIQARYRDSLKVAGLYEDVLADKRKYDVRKSPPVVPFKNDPLLAAFFG